MSRHRTIYRIFVALICAAALSTQAQNSSGGNVPPSKLVSKPASPASIKFTIRLNGAQDEPACREWLGRMFGEVKQTHEASPPGNIIRSELSAEKLFQPPFTEADALHAAVPKSPCGKGVLSLSVTHSLNADEARRNLKAL